MSCTRIENRLPVILYTEKSRRCIHLNLCYMAALQLKGTQGKWVSIRNVYMIVSSRDSRSNRFIARRTDRLDSSNRLPLIPSLAEDLTETDPGQTEFDTIQSIPLVIESCIHVNWNVLSQNEREHTLIVEKNADRANNNLGRCGAQNPLRKIHSLDSHVQGGVSTVLSLRTFGAWLRRPKLEVIARNHCSVEVVRKGPNGHIDEENRVRGPSVLRQDFGFRPCKGAHQRAYPLP